MDVAEQLHARWSRFAEQVARPRSCLFCKGIRIWWNGFSERAATVWEDGARLEVEPFVIRRVKCASCKRSWGLRPPGVFPHRWYQLDVIAEAAQRVLFEPGATVESVAAVIGCAARTVSRWSAWVAGLAAPSRLLSLLAGAADEPVLPRLLEARRPSLRRAGQVLGLLEVLAAALGLEPPGLRSVLLAVVGDRTRLTTQSSPFLPESAWRRLRGGSASLPM